jgi:hypothetical protein
VGFAQDLPPVTEAAQKAATELVLLCQNNGALKGVINPRTRIPHTIVANEAKLKEIIQQQRKHFTPAVRDALLRYNDHPGVLALLLGLGQETKDDRAVAFAHFFSAWSLAGELKYLKARPR